MSVPAGNFTFRLKQVHKYNAFLCNYMSGALNDNDEKMTRKRLQEKDRGWVRITSNCIRVNTNHYASESLGVSAYTCMFMSFHTFDCDCTALILHVSMC